MRNSNVVLISKGLLTGMHFLQCLSRAMSQMHFMPLGLAKG